MANKTVSNLKTNNRDWKHVMDSFVPSVYQNYSVVTDSTLTAVANNEYVLNRAAGIAVTLPTMVAGDRFRFHVGITVSSNTTTITSPAGFLYVGHTVIRDDADGAANDYKYFAADGSDDLIFTMNGSTQGGLIGDVIDLYCVSTSEVRIIARLSGNGTLATNFS